MARDSITAYFDLSNPDPREADFSIEKPTPLIADFGINVTSSTVFWGSIFGDLLNQVDLKEALELLYPKSNPENYTSNKITFKIWYKEGIPEFIVVSDDEGNLVIDTDYVEVISDEGGNVVLSESDIHVTDDDNGNVFINSGE